MRYLHGTQVDQVLAQEDGNGNVNWLLSDHLGSIRDLVDNTANVVNHLTYDSYGNVVAESNPTVDSRYRFTGREWDEELDLYYYRARYYSGETGRFISIDPIGFAGSNMNLYGYANNNPTNRIDPSGLKDTRAPGNGAVTNRSSNPVIILNSNQSGDYPEALYPGQSTPDMLGRSKDADGVWVCRGDKWEFYRVSLGKIRWQTINLPIPISSPNVMGATFASITVPFPLDVTLGDVTVTDTQVRDRAGRVLSPTQASSGGRPSSNNLFQDKCDCNSVHTVASQYPDASVWRPVLPQDSWLGSAVEQVLNYPSYKGSQIASQLSSQIQKLGNLTSWGWRLF